MTERVMTIYNHGTGNSRTKSDSNAEIIFVFGNEHEKASPSKQELVDFIITDGVASEGKPHESMIVIDPSDGSLKRKSLLKKKAALTSVFEPLPKSKLRVKDLFKKLENNDTVLNVTGKGAMENVHSVLNVLAWTFANDLLPTKINMMGWSRGAVTSVRIAYWLSKAGEWAESPEVGKALQAIPINIFSIDPVAGPGHESEPDVINIGPNVMNYVATLALGDDRLGFKPIDLTRLKIHPKTNAVVLPLPGVHADTAEWTQPSGHVSFNLGWRFLQTHGTPLAPGLAQFKQGNRAALLAYTKLGQDLSKLHKSDRISKRGFWSALLTGGGKVSRDIDHKLYVGDAFFFNAHHQALFQKEYPQTYRAYFGAGRATRSSEAWKKEWGDKITPELVKLVNGEVPELRALEPDPIDPQEASRSQARQKAIAASGLID